MFFFRKPKPVRPCEIGSASPLLAFVAGDFAGRIASLWPAPHSPFLTASAARRHLLCLALTQASPVGAEGGDAILNRPLRRAIPLALTTPPIGLARALDRLGESAWSAADYGRLLALLAGRASGKILRHRDQITVGEVRALSLLPETLIDQGLGRLLLNEAAAGVVAETFAGVEGRDGEAAALVLAKRWGSAETLKSLVEMVRHDLEPEAPATPFEGTARLRPLATKAALTEAALRFKNCLRNHLRWACSGDSAFYEWVEAPSAVLEITRDRLHGWTLDQARLAENKPVPEPTRSAIIAELRSMGIHVGRCQWRLNDALGEIAQTPPGRVTSEAEAIGEIFGDN